MIEWMNKYKTLRTLLISQRTRLKQICETFGSQNGIQAIASKLTNVSESPEIVSKICQFFIHVKTPQFFHILSDFLSSCSINCWERGVDVSNYNCGLTLFLLSVLSLLHIFCSCGLQILLENKLLLEVRWSKIIWKASSTETKVRIKNYLRLPKE